MPYFIALVNYPPRAPGLPKLSLAAGTELFIIKGLELSDCNRRQQETEVPLLQFRFKRWLYRGGRPNALARAVNAGWAAVHSLGIAPSTLVTLVVRGSRTGRAISLPLAMVALDGERYLVSMLGNEAAWVRNVRAADGHALLRHGKTEKVLLVLVPVEQRPRILKLYLQRAPGARPHIPVDKDAPLGELAAIAADYPVFRVLGAEAAEEDTRRR